MTWAGSAGDLKAAWCVGQVGLGTATAIGTGAANTRAVAGACGATSAAGFAAGYRGGGKSDWFLPSLDELSTLSRWLRTASPAQAPAQPYWSSSQSGGADSVSTVALGSGAAGVMGKNQITFLRPVRAFSSVTAVLTPMPMATLVLVQPTLPVPTPTAAKPTATTAYSTCPSCRRQGAQL